MNPIAEKFFSLNEDGKKRAHLFMAELALKSWESSLAQGKVPMSYRETVTGTTQAIDPDLPKRALDSLKSETNSLEVAKDYLEPICALQDDDWIFNDDAQMAYYAIYNTYRKYIEGEEIDDWVIVNQALSSLGEGADIFTPLKEAVEQC